MKKHSKQPMESSSHRERSIVVAMDLSDQSTSGIMGREAIQCFAMALEEATGLPLTQYSITGTHGDHAVEKLLALSRNRKNPIEMYVTGMGDLSTPRRLYPGAFTEELVRHSRRPVAILGPGALSIWSKGVAMRKPLRLLVSTELGRNSRPAEHYALSLARRTEASVTLLHNVSDTYRTMEDSAIQSGMVPIDFEEIIESMTNKARRALGERVRFYNWKGVSCDFILDEEVHPTYQSILSREDDGYSVIFTGTRSRNLLIETFLGSTLRDTLSETTLPVIAVKG